MTCEEKVQSPDYRELMADHTITETVAGCRTENCCATQVDSNISILYFLPEEKESLDIVRYPYYSIPKCYGLMEQEDIQAGLPFDSLALSDAGILQVQNEPLALTGRGVIVGIIDTGIRYTQDVFRDSNGNSRILAIWDQTLNEGGKAPEGFFYGTEYSREQINEALRSGTPREVVPSWDTEGHGTAMASVAAGSNLNNGRTFIGAAPDADIVVVKMREAKRYLRDYYLLPEDAAAYAETDVIMAVKYVEQYAIAMERPVVICLGIGTSYGSHTGSSMLDRYLNTVAAKRSRVIVACGGNEGASGHHFEGSASPEPQNVELRVGESGRGFILEVWSEGPNRYQISLRTPGGEVINGLGGRDRRTEEYSFIFDKTTITVHSVLLEEASNRSLVLFQFDGPTPGVWTFTIEADVALSNSKYNIWLPINAFLDSDTYFLRPEPDITLTAPATAEGVITVNAYNDADGGFYEKSGRGFTADRRIKPEFAAPGVDISTSLGRRTGSSLAAAIAAGAAAQLMQWSVVEKKYPLASGRELKYYLALGAVRDSNMQYPNREWGLGRINVQRTFQELAGLF